jgi:hypothetical protein
MPAVKELWDSDGAPLNKRQEPRIQVGSVQPVGLRLLKADETLAPWLVADILDISHSGMALLLSSAPLMELDQAVLLDVSAHPDFGRVRLPAYLRWFVVSPVVTTVGVQFDQPLVALPRLAQSRK